MLVYFFVYFCGCVFCDGIHNKTGKGTLEPARKELELLRRKLNDLKSIQNELLREKRNLRHHGDLEIESQTEKASFTVENKDGKTEGVVEDGQLEKQLQKGVKKIAKAACRCACFVSKTISNVVKICYGKLRSWCCKEKPSEKPITVKRDVSDCQESLDFGLY